LCLWILDVSAPAIWPEGELRDIKKIRFVANKTDLPAVWDVQQFAAIPVSAKTSAGLAELVDALAQWLVPDPPPAGTAVPFTSALASMIDEALGHSRAGQTEELKQILAALANDNR
jgi:hypothetical protein